MSIVPPTTVCIVSTTCDAIVSAVGLGVGCGGRNFAQIAIITQENLVCINPL